MDPMVSIAHAVKTLADGASPVIPKYAVVTASASGNTQVVAAVSGKRILVLCGKVTWNGTVNVKWQSATTDITGLDYLIANTGWVLPFSPVGWFRTAVGEALNINLSGNVAVGGHLTYAEVTD